MDRAAVGEQAVAGQVWWSTAAQGSELQKRVLAKLRVNCRVQTVRPLEAESRLVGTGGGEALLAYCLVDFSPVENAGKGAEIPCLASFQTSRKIGAGEIAPRFLTLGNRREPGGDLSFQSSPKVLNGSAKSRKVVFGSIRSPS
ncbi:unnamed protein product [Miscanthus lutarioriparius]|uniref:Uncharacterized protein n=1 Tax=Miscanthus lutarioriparius TaxID=422564 RepID=A0A811R269_9POAL|nr:unnamed protein product [Miscanthus lutarioriparius]